MSKPSTSVKLYEREQEDPNLISIMSESDEKCSVIDTDDILTFNRRAESHYLEPIAMQAKLITPSRRTIPTAGTSNRHNLKL